MVEQAQTPVPHIITHGTALEIPKETDAKSSDARAQDSIFIRMDERIILQEIIARLI